MVARVGHGIPEEAIERRYYESLDNLKEVLNIYNEINRTKHKPMILKVSLVYVIIF